jgi:tetratricopeptide (TPR) repeat protein
MSIQKIYLHFEADDNRCLTKVYRLDLSDLNIVSSTFQDFVSKVTSTFQDLVNANFALSNQRGKIISFSALAEEIEDGNDFFLALRPGQKEVQSSSGATSATIVSTSQQSAIAIPNKLPSNEDIKRVEEYLAAKSLQKARLLLQNWLPTLRSSGETKEEMFCLRVSMLIDVAAQRFDSAVATGQYGVRKYKSTGIELYYLLAQAYMGREDYDEAVQCMESALKLWNVPAAKKLLPSSKRNDAFYLELVAYMADCLFSAGQHMEAADQVNQVMGLPGAEDNLSILVAYSRFALQYNKLSDALNAVMKVIVSIGTKDPKQQPANARKLLADFFSAKGAIALFQSKLPSASKGSGEVYGYLGSTVKDFSRFDAAVSLYELALQSDGSNASFILNLAHIIEMKADLTGALKEIVAFCRRNPSLGVNTSAKSGASLTCAEFADLLCNESAAINFSNSCTMNWVAGDESHAEIVLGDGSIDAVNVGSVLYTQKEIDLLAVFALATKLLYLMDKRAYLPAIIQKVELVRRQSQKRLHETNVRNELAYYQDIAQIVCCYYNGSAQPYFRWPAVTSSTTKPIYVCGDSHSLSAAWAELNVKGELRKLVPKLVTGLKQWHLRDASTFHPKQVFNNSVASMPDRAEVVMLVGEIDCREGLLLAVEKDCYENLEIAIQKTIAIFVKVLQQLRKKRGFKVLI